MEKKRGMIPELKTKKEKVKLRGKKKS